MVSNLYIDVDETLVFWDDPLKPYCGNYTVNDALVLAVCAVLDVGYPKVSIWSGGGKAWASEMGLALFEGYDLESFDKYDTWDKIPEFSMAVDDRVQDERYYLRHFDRVFSPDEFVKEYTCFL
jgi:hypothetical protein|tara:strand:+ start:2669 stop:3037 length:369 start_codon:yes stop_codon:yes gene_type:complete